MRATQWRRLASVTRRVAVLGASGQLGQQLVQHLRGRRDVELLAASRTDAHPELRFDLGAPQTIGDLVRRIRPDHTILAAAATNVAWCEAHPSETHTLNVTAPTVTAEACDRVGSSLTFVSTDYVFDGMAGPSGETDPTHPLNEYGSQKLAAERAVLGAVSTNLVIRTCQVFGPDARRVNYVARVVDGLRGDGVVDAPIDLFGTPTYAPDLASGLIDLTLGQQTGVWHVAGESYLSRYDLAVAVAAAFELDNTHIVGISADQMTDQVKRPRRAGLRNDRMHREGRNWMTPLDAALRALAARENER